jgi:ribosome-associated protein
MMTMRRARDLDEVRTWAAQAARAADGKLGADTIVLEVGPVLAITDLFVITSAPNPRLVRTICDEIELVVKADDGPAPIRIEGLDDARWVLMDYGDFIVHIFLDEARAYYDLERLWADAPRLDWAAA